MIAPARDQLHKEMISYSVKIEEVAVIENHSCMEKAIREKKPIWLIIHSRMSNWKHPSKANRNRKVGKWAGSEAVKLSFDQDVQECVELHWLELCVYESPQHYGRRLKQLPGGRTFADRKRLQKALETSIDHGKSWDLYKPLPKEKHFRFHRLIIDEAHMATHWSSALTEVSVRPSSMALNVWLLSATLVPTRRANCMRRL